METARTEATNEKSETKKKRSKITRDPGADSDRDLALLARVLHISQHNPTAMKGCLMALGVDMDIIVDSNRKNSAILPLMPHGYSRVREVSTN